MCVFAAIIRQYGSATQDDLWNYLTQQADLDNRLPQGQSVKSIMDTWTLQMGYPLVTVSRNPDNKVSLSQV